VVATDEDAEVEAKDSSLADLVIKQPESIPACSLFLDRATEDPDIDEGLMGATTDAEDVIRGFEGKVLGLEVWGV